MFVFQDVIVDSFCTQDSLVLKVGIVLVNIIILIMELPLDPDENKTVLPSFWIPKLLQNQKSQF